MHKTFVHDIVPASQVTELRSFEVISDAKNRVSFLTKCDVPQLDLLMLHCYSFIPFVSTGIKQEMNCAEKLKLWVFIKVSWTISYFMVKAFNNWLVVPLNKASFSFVASSL